MERRVTCMWGLEYSPTIQQSHKASGPQTDNRDAFSALH